MPQVHDTLIEVPALTSSEAWDAPILFGDKEAPDIHAHWLPDILSHFASALSESTETPEALSVMSVLGVLSSVLATRVCVSPKEGWEEPVNLYTLIALPPANHKSLILKACTQPLITWEKTQALQRNASIKRHQSEQKTKGIDGGEVRVRRKDRALSLRPYLSILLTVQPAVLQSMSEKRAYLGNGMLERFLYVLPKSTLGYRTHDKPSVPDAIKHEYHTKLTTLLNEFALPEKQTATPCKLTLSPCAYSAWRDFQLCLEKELRPEGKLGNCPGWGGKIAGFTLRIAGLLHVAEHGTETTLIHEDTLKNTLHIANALVEHAVLAFECMCADESRRDAKLVFDWIMKEKASTFTRSQIMSAMRNRTLGKSIIRFRSTSRCRVTRPALPQAPSPKNAACHFHGTALTPL